MDKNVVRFMEQIKKALGDNLKSFIVYGSAATGEVYKYSDYNTLMVMGSIDTATLKMITRPVDAWVKKGQPIPMILTLDSMMASQDVFPLEFLDIKENHVMLFGRDVFKDMKISPKNLRLEIERELKSKLIRLRQSFILTGGNSGKIKRLLIRSISTFAAILKGIIRLYGNSAPAKKSGIFDAAPAALKLDKELFRLILSVKEQRADIKNSEIEGVFTRYMGEIDRMADIIDKK